jgi:pyruvate/2-oxoglutarate dehydrogenase complex dihydrolipoamide acyltransferase (E2) component
MQGTIVKVLVTVGQEVKAGDAVMVLEAMKMENQLQADKSGTVSAIKVKAGDKVGSGDVLVVISGPTPRRNRPTPGEGAQSISVPFRSHPHPRRDSRDSRDSRTRQ